MWWRMGGTDTTRSLRWTQSLKRSIDVLVTVPTTDVATVFWIRLYGVLVEVRKGHEPAEVELSDSSPGKEEQTSSALSEEDQYYEDWAAEEDEYFGGLAADVLAACQALRSEFTEEELLFIQWKRDDEAHVLLDGYELQEQHGKLVLHRRKSILGRSVLQQRVRDVVQTARMERDDLASAVAFAQRAASHVDAVIAALQEFPQ